MKTVAAQNMWPNDFRSVPCVFIKKMQFAVCEMQKGKHSVFQAIKFSDDLEQTFDIISCH